MTHYTKPVVSHLLTERMDTISDIGASLSELREKFPDCDFSLLLDADRPNPEHERNLFMASFVGRKIRRERGSDVKKRIDLFLSFLLEQEHESVCVVGHSHYFQIMTGESKMNNCEARSFLLSRSDRSLTRVS